MPGDPRIALFAKAADPVGAYYAGAAQRQAYDATAEDSKRKQRERIVGYVLNAAPYLDTQEKLDRFKTVTGRGDPEFGAMFADMQLSDVPALQAAFTPYMDQQKMAIDQGKYQLDVSKTNADIANVNNTMWNRDRSTGSGINVDNSSIANNYNQIDNRNAGTALDREKFDYDRTGGGIPPLPEPGTPSGPPRSAFLSMIGAAPRPGNGSMLLADPGSGQPPSPPGTVPVMPETTPPPAGTSSEGPTAIAQIQRHWSGVYGKAARAGYRYSREGREEPLSDPSAAPKAPYRLTAKTVNDLSGAGEAAMATEQNASGFQEDYAGFGSDMVGDLSNWETRNIGSGILGLVGLGQSDQGAGWWQQYQQRKNITRNNLFGSALTATEKAEFEKADISPGMRPELIRDNLGRQQAVAQRAAKKLAGAWLAQGADPAAVESALGIPLSELGVALPAGLGASQSSPVELQSDEEWDQLPSGASFIGPDGQVRVKE